MASSDFLLVLDKIQGEEKDADFPQSIKIKAWSFSGAAPSDVASGRRTGRIQMSDLVVTKDLDRASPVLIQAMTTNQNIATAKLVCRKAGGSPQGYYTITMTDAGIRSVTTKGGLGQAGIALIPEEVVAISYGKILWEYSGQLELGALGGKTSWAWNNRKASDE